MVGEKPLWKIWVRQLGWLAIPNWTAKIKNGNQTTNQSLIGYTTPRTKQPVFLQLFSLLVQMLRPDARGSWRKTPRSLVGRLVWLWLSGLSLFESSWLPLPLDPIWNTPYFVLDLMIHELGPGKIGSSYDPGLGLLQRSTARLLMIARASSFATCHVFQGLVNVPIKHHPTIGDIMWYNIQHIFEGDVQNLQKGTFTKLPSPVFLTQIAPQSLSQLGYHSSMDSPSNANRRSSGAASIASTQWWFRCHSQWTGVEHQNKVTVDNYTYTPYTPPFRWKIYVFYTMRGNGDQNFNPHMGAGMKLSNALLAWLREESLLVIIMRYFHSISSK